MNSNIISIYCKGSRKSSSYYRSYQYFDKLVGANSKYRVMMSRGIEKNFMPVSQKGFSIKVFVYLHIFFRTTFHLLSDSLNPPKIIFVHKCFIPHYMPKFFYSILKYMKRRGTAVYWDIDDNIKGHDLKPRDFDKYSKLASMITVTHDFLKNTISPKYHNKVAILRTTDGDMYQLFSPEVNVKRLETFSKEIKLVWVATKVNLEHLEIVLPFLDKAAKTLYKNQSKTLALYVLCDGKVNYNPNHLKLFNIKWSRDEAINKMLECHIGIMPLMDNEFTKGKGGFKLVQYQSVGLPSIASDVGFNRTVLRNDSGILVSTQNLDEWIEAITFLSNKENWINYSNNVFQNWNMYFSFENNLKFWQKHFDTPVN